MCTVGKLLCWRSFDFSLTKKFSNVTGDESKIKLLDDGFQKKAQIELGDLQLNLEEFELLISPASTFVNFYFKWHIQLFAELNTLLGY